jgi:hypothetical protein
MMKSNDSEPSTATPGQQPLVEIASGIEGYPDGTVSPSGLDFIFGRIFYGKPVATFPENA